MKVVINNCFGGFSLSHEAMIRYGAIKGYTVYPEEISGAMGLFTYWIVPPEERPKELPEPWIKNPIEDRKAFNRECTEKQLDTRPDDRADPALVQVVEEMGEAANGRCADLRIVDIPDGVNWTIEEYDGNEWVAEAHRTWT